MAFSLQKLLNQKYLIVATTAAVIAASSFLTALQNYGSYQASGYSMLPNYWPEQIITGHKNFKEIVRHQVYMTTEDRHQRAVGGTVTDSVLTKRVIGLPGDQLTFDRQSGALLRINQQHVSYAAAPHLVALKTTDKINHSVWHTQAYRYTDGFGGDFLVYQLLPGQQGAADPQTQRSMSKYTQFTYLNQLSASSDTEVTVKLGADEYFLLSDNRTIGVDSRYYGPVSRSEFLYEVDTQATPELAINNPQKNR